MRDYYKNVTTTLTPKRASAVFAIANRLCALRDTTKHFDDYVLTELLEDKDKRLLRTIYVKFPHSNSLLGETVNDALPSRLKGKTFILVVHRKKRLYHYQFAF
jgi:hypothetical protein